MNCLQYLDHTVVPVLRAALKELVMKRYTPCKLTSPFILVHRSSYSSASCLPSPILMLCKICACVIIVLGCCRSGALAVTTECIVVKRTSECLPADCVLLCATGPRTHLASWPPTSLKTSQNTHQQPPRLDVPIALKHSLACIGCQPPA